MTEEEFWENYAEDDQEFNKGRKRIDSIDSQNAGISNKPFILMPRQNISTQKSEFTLE